MLQESSQEPTLLAQRHVSVGLVGLAVPNHVPHVDRAIGREVLYSSPPDIGGPGSAVAENDGCSGSESIPADHRTPPVALIA